MFIAEIFDSSHTFARSSADLFWPSQHSPPEVFRPQTDRNLATIAPHLDPFINWTPEFSGTLQRGYFFPRQSKVASETVRN